LDTPYILVLLPGFFLEKNPFSHLACTGFGYVHIQKTFIPVWFWNQVQGWFFCLACHRCQV
jgi:hypothetical protein